MFIWIMATKPFKDADSVFRDHWVIVAALIRNETTPIWLSAIAGEGANANKPSANSQFTFFIRLPPAIIAVSDLLK